MIIFRIISLVVIAAALMLLGADVVGYMENDTVSLRSLLSVISLVSADAATGMTEWKETLPGAVEPVLSVVYNAPAWLCLGVIGILLAFLFRERG